MNDKLQEKLNLHMGRESSKWAAKALESPRDNFDIAKISYQAGFVECSKLMEPLIEAMSEIDDFHALEEEWTEELEEMRSIAVTAMNEFKKELER